MSDLSDSKNDDVLANEVSVGLEVSGVPNLPIEVKGKAKSRFVSACDRLLGNIVDFPNAWLEAAPAKKRAKTAKEVEAIKQGHTIAQGIDDPAVRHAVQQFVAEAMDNQDKKILLLQETIEELKKNPPNAEQAAQGSEQLDEGFLNRLSKHTEEATEAEIRDKWSKVLAGEIRKPGTFSPKVLRIIDEVKPAVAEFFQKICTYRIGDAILICLSGEIEFSQKKQLENAGLIIASELGMIRRFREIKDDRGNEFWASWFNIGSVAFSKDAKLASPIMEAADPIRWSGTAKPEGIPCYALTEEGSAIASIFEDKQTEAFHTYLEKLSVAMPDVEVKEFSPANDKGESKPIRSWKNGKSLELKFYPYEGYSY